VRRETSPVKGARGEGKGGDSQLWYPKKKKRPLSRLPKEKETAPPLASGERGGVESRGEREKARQKSSRVTTPFPHGAKERLTADGRRRKPSFRSGGKVRGALRPRKKQKETKKKKKGKYRFKKKKNREKKAKRKKPI